MEIIRGEKIIKNYNEVRVLKGLDISINSGEFIGIMGKSGSGKSTLLKILGMIDPVTDGIIHYNGNDLKSISSKETARIRREELGFIFQEFFLMESLSVIENVMLPLFIDKSANLGGKEKAKKLMEEFNITRLEDKSPDELSGGERQRVAICRALINNPKVVFADEPTGNLDSKSGQIVIDLLETINKELGKTIVMVTHDPQMASYCDRVILLKDGEILGELKKEKDNKGFYKKIIESMIDL